MSNQAEVNFNLKIPQQWLGRLTKSAQENNHSVEDLILTVLAEYFNFNERDFQIQQLHQELQQLRQRVIQLEEQDYQFAQLTKRLNILEKLIASLQTQWIKLRPSTSLSLVEEYDDDDIYDEPDEVLTDFLPN